jgi:hypothetical protein
MNFDVFRESIQQDMPPVFSNPLLLAMWHEGRGEWDKSHDIAQDISSNEGAWVHAYLHRKEGDIWNADYWYNRAGRKRPSYDLETEWINLTQWFLDQE